jgi:hypothetical protein
MTLTPHLVNRCIKYVNKSSNAMDLNIKLNIFFAPINSAILFRQFDSYKFYNFYYVYMEHNYNAYKHNTINDDIHFKIFTKIIKTRSAFLSLWKIWKHTTYPTIISTDLCLSKLDTKHKYTMCIVKNNKKYLFSAIDLKKIVFNSLSNNDLLFSEPLQVKNPYDNEVFSNTELYNIYFFLKSRNIAISEIFQQYFKHNFNMYTFKNKCAVLLRYTAIDKLSQCDDLDNVELESMLMIEYYNSYASRKNKIHIAPNFPANILVNAMRPYLRIYYMGIYGLDKLESRFYLQEYINRLYFFKQWNPKFGRVNYKCNTNYNGKYIIETAFQTKYTPFLSSLPIKNRLIDVLSIFRQENAYDELYEDDYYSDNTLL